MVRTYNIGTECYALITSHTDADFLLPVKIVITEKYVISEHVTYKVKIKDIYENDFEYLKEHLYGLKVSMSLKSVNQTTLIKKTIIDSIKSKKEVLDNIKDIGFFIEENYIALDIPALKYLYTKFVKYLINYHFKKIYQITNRSFLEGTSFHPVQKELFERRINRIGFGDMFEKCDINIKI